LKGGIILFKILLLICNKNMLVEKYGDKQYSKQELQRVDILRETIKKAFIHTIIILAIAWLLSITIIKFINYSQLIVLIKLSRIVGPALVFWAVHGRVGNFGGVRTLGGESLVEKLNVSWYKMVYNTGILISVTALFL